MKNRISTFKKPGFRGLKFVGNSGFSSRRKTVDIPYFLPLASRLALPPRQFAYHWVIITHLAEGGVSAVEDEEGESDSQVRTDVVR